MELSVLLQRVKVAWLAVMADGLLVALCWVLQQETFAAAFGWIAAVLVVWAMRESRHYLSAARFGRIGRYWFPGGDRDA